MGVDEVGGRGRLKRAARAGAGVCGGLCLAGCCAWMAPHLGWVVDLAAIFTGHAVAGSVVVAGCALLVRSRAGVVLALGAALVGGAGLVRGRALLPGGAGDGRNGGRVLRVLVYNAHALNPDRAGVLGVIGRADADVVVLLEPEITLSRAIRWDGALSAEYPHRANRAWVRRAVSEVIVLSREPLEGVELGGVPGDDPRAMAVVVGEGASAVGLVAGQPRSPRSAARWAAGNEEAAVHARLVGELGARGLPVVFCADLNSTPSGHRGGVMRGAGLRPAKALLEPAGTFPAWLAWPMRVAIDDAWVSRSVGVRSWAIAGSGGSDHAGVVMELEMEPAAGPGAGGGG